MARSKTRKQTSAFEETQKQMFGGSDAGAGFGVAEDSGQDKRNKNTGQDNAEKAAYDPKDLDIILQNAANLPSDRFQLAQTARRIVGEHQRRQQVFSVLSNMLDEAETQRKGLVELMNSDVNLAKKNIADFIDLFNKTLAQETYPPIRLKYLDEWTNGYMSNAIENLEDIEAAYDFEAGGRYDEFLRLTQDSIDYVQEMIGIEEDSILPSVEKAIEKALDEQTEAEAGNKTVKTFSSEIIIHYTRLPENNAVRNSAAAAYEKYQEFYKNQFVPAQRSWDNQKKAAAELVTMATGLLQAIKDKRIQWDNMLLSQDVLDDVLRADIDRTVDRWGGEVDKLLKKYQFENVEQVCPLFAEALEEINELEQIDDEGLSAELDEITDMLIAAVDKLPHVMLYGCDGIADVYQKAKEKLDGLTGKLTEMESKVFAELEKIGNNPQAKAWGVSASRLAQVIVDPPPTTDVDGVPSSVPNYRQAIDSSPRVCGNCRFFQGQPDGSGVCIAFKFAAKAHYICDAWQAMPTKAEIVYMSDKPVVVPGKVPETHYDYQNIGDTTVDVENMDTESYGATMGRDEPARIMEKDVQLEDNEIMRQLDAKFVANDVVYVRSLRSLAIVQTNETVGNVHYYGLKLIDSSGIVTGSCVTTENDLQPRAQRAVKRTKSNQASYRADNEYEDIEAMIQSVRSLFTKVNQLCSKHKDYQVQPLSNKDHLTPLRGTMLGVLQSDLFNGVTSGPKRKYYRAVQMALSSVGAARQILFESYRDIIELKRDDTTSKSMLRGLLFKAQEDAYACIQDAQRVLKDSLVLPSATNGDNAPGLNEP